MRPWYLVSVIVAFLLLAANIIAVPIVAPQGHNLPVHKTLYLDRNLTDTDMAVIIAAADEWHEATNGMVTFDVEKLPSDHVSARNGIIICIVSPDFPEVVQLDTDAPDASHMAYYYPSGPVPYIAVLPERISDEDYQGVILHELGHALGLKHNEGINGVGTLMYPNIDYGATWITERDLKNFCKLYGCDASKLHDDEEPSHP